MPLAALLTKDLARRKKRGSPSDEPALYGAPLPAELAALLAANETHPLDRQTWGELRPLFFEEPFALPGRDAAKKHLVRATKLGWPVYFEAHFWNAFPFGATVGADYWLAQIETEDEKTSPVFLYDHETGELTREAASIAELVRRERGAGKPTRAKAPRTKPAAHLDPLALYARTYWLTTLLRGQTPDDLEAELAKAPAFAAFAAEKRLLAGSPHLALYWLFAHALLGNAGAFAEACELTAPSKNAFVASARALCKDLLADPKKAAGALTAKWRAEIAALLEQQKPLRLLEPARRAAVEAGAAKEKKRVASVTKGGDPLALIEAHPLDLDVQLAAIAALGKREGGDLRAAAELLAAFAKRGGSPGRSKWPPSWRTLFADGRLENLLLLLFRRGQTASLAEPLHSDWFIEPLAKIGGPRVTEAFVEALTLPSHRGRKSRLAEVLHASTDPRVSAFFDKLAEFWRSPKLAHTDKQDVQRYARATIARCTALGDRPGLERALGEILRAVEGPLRFELAATAAELGATSVSEALVEALRPWLEDEDPPHYSSQEHFLHLGGALAELSPALAAKHHEPVWKRYLEYGPLEEAATSHNLFAIGSAVLVPLLGSTAKARYLPIAKTFAGWLEAHDLTARRVPRELLRGTRHLLRGFRLSGDPFARTLAKKFVAFETERGAEEAAAIRAEAARILDRA